jgi:hypothetical protein
MRGRRNERSNGFGSGMSGSQHVFSMAVPAQVLRVASSLGLPNPSVTSRTVETGHHQFKSLFRNNSDHGGTTLRNSRFNRMRDRVDTSAGRHAKGL